MSAHTMKATRIENRENYITRTSTLDVHAHIESLLGSAYRAYRQAWEQAGPDNIPAFPVHLDLELADLCNKTCLFCPRNLERHPHFQGMVGTGETLSDDIIQRLAAEAGAHGLRSLNLGAGCEPLINDNVLEVVNRFHAAGVIDSWIITNGVLLERWIEPILDSGLVNLFVSIDAHTEATYRQLRGEGFADVFNGVLKFIAAREQRNAGLPLVRVSFIDHPRNRHEREDFVNFWTDKVDMVDVQNFFDYAVEDFTLRHPPKRACRDPYRRLVVRGNGEVIPCASDFGLDLVLGDVRTQSLKQIWEGARLARVRTALAKGTHFKCNFCQTI